MTRARDLGDFIADGAAAELVVDTTTLVVDSTNNRVGIGTASPATALDVTGTVTSDGLTVVGDVTVTGDTFTITSSAQDDPVLLIQNTTNDSNSARLKFNKDRGAAAQDGDDIADIIFAGENDAQQAVTYAAVRVEAADVSDGSEDGTIAFQSMKAGTLSDSLKIDSSGLVGIGTNSPSRKLSVFDSSAPYLALQNSTSGSTTSDGLQFQLASANSYLWNYENGFMALATNNAERFRIGTSGQLGIGGATYGTSGQVLTSGGSGAAPTWADAAGGGTLEFTASENLAAGDVLVLDNSNGQVGKVTVTAAFGSVTTLNTAQVVQSQKQTFYDSTNGFAIGIYRKESGTNSYRYWSVKDGETAFTATSSNIVSSAMNQGHTAYDPVQNTFLHVYRRGSTSYYKTSIPNTSSIGYLTVSSEASLPFNIGSSPQMASCYDSDAGKIILIYRDDNDSNSITKYVVATCNGNSASFGSVGTVTNYTIGVGSYERHSDATYDDTANRVLFLYRSSSTANSTRCVAGSVSGTTVTWGTDTQLDGGANYALSIMYDSVSGKNLVVYGDGSNIQSRAVTLSGSTISTGSETTIASSFDGKGTDIYFNSTTQQLNVAGSNHSGDLNVYPGTISGTAWSSGGSYAGLYSGNAQNPQGAYNPNDGRGYVFYTDADASDAGKVAYFSSSSNNASNFIGLAAATISSGSSGKVTLLGGVNENVTGLTIGSTYYVSIGGGLSTVDTGTKVGKAVAATKILISGGA